MVSGMSRIINAVTEGLNKRLRLPKYVIMILDQDFLKITKMYEFGVYHALKKSLEWLVRQISTLIVRKRTDLLDKKPGSLTQEFTQIIWVKMLKRPDIGDFSQIQALRPKFNKALEEVLFESTYKEHYILTIEVDPSEFTTIGTLSGIGKNSFWLEVDRCMKKFERKEINRKPRGPISLVRTSILQQKSKRRVHLPAMFKRNMQNCRPIY